MTDQILTQTTTEPAAAPAVHPDWQRLFREAQALQRHKDEERQRQYNAEQEAKRQAECERQNADLARLLAALGIEHPVDFNCGSCNLGDHRFTIYSFGERKNRGGVTTPDVQVRFSIGSYAYTEGDGTIRYGSHEVELISPLDELGNADHLVKVADTIDQADERAAQMKADHEERRRERERLNARSMEIDAEQMAQPTPPPERSSIVRYYQFSIYNTQTESEIEELLCDGWRQVAMSVDDDMVTVCLVNQSAWSMEAF